MEPLEPLEPLNKGQETEPTMLSVLIIDDNRHIRTQINLVLKLEGYKTFEAENGVEGVALAKEHNPTLIVCDIVMPELDGYGVLEQLRAYAPTADTPFLFLSAKADKSDMREGMNLGADDYLIKPFSAQELVQAIAARLRRHDTTRRTLEKKIETQYSRSQDKFFSLVTHDLKSSFAGVMGLSEMLSKKLDEMSVERLQEVADLMKESVQSTYGLLDSFVEWSRLQASGMVPVLNSVNIGETALRVIMQYSSMAAHKTIEVSCSIPPDTHVLADSNMIQVVFRNLISNALKFTRPGGTIDVAAVIEGETVTVSVKDSGVGMSAEEIARMFKSDLMSGIQHSSRGTSGEKGTGLGVLFCREILEKHNTMLKVESLIDLGSMFSFTLPRVK
jgi:signal transduction histidine kinase